LAFTLYLESLIKSSFSQKLVPNFFGIIIIILGSFLLQPKAKINYLPLLPIPFLIVLEPVCLSLEASMVVSPGQKIRAEVYGNICTETYIDSYCNT